MSAKSDNNVIQSTLKELGLGPSTTRVYEYLLSVQKASAKQIAEVLGMPRPSVYDQLTELTRLKLIAEFKENNKRWWQAESGEELLHLIEGKEKRIKEQKKLVEEFLPEIKNMQSPGAEPRVRFFPGRDGTQVVLTDAVLSRAKEILVMWPFADMTDVVGKDALRAFTNERVDRNIPMRSLWAYDLSIKPKKLPNEACRIVPKGHDWHMGYLIYEDRVSFISSRKESFAFSVHSHDFAELKKMEFEVLWKISKEVKFSN